MAALCLWKPRDHPEQSQSAKVFGFHGGTFALRASCPGGGRLAISIRSETGGERPMSDPECPDKYWHCLVAHPGPKKEARQGIRNDFTFADLGGEVLEEP